MTDRKIKEAEFTRQHTLSPEQFKKLLEGKLARAIHYSEQIESARLLKGDCGPQSVNIQETRSWLCT